MTRPEDIPMTTFLVAEDLCKEVVHHWAEGREAIARAIIAAEKRGADAAIAALTYSSTQSTKCVCGEVKHTPLRRDEMGGYVCLTCIDKRLDAVADIEKAAEKRGEDREREACRQVAQEIADGRTAQSRQVKGLKVAYDFQSMAMSAAGVADAIQRRGSA